MIKTYQNSRNVEFYHFWLKPGIHNGSIYRSSLYTVPRSFEMLFHQLSWDIRPQCVDSHPRKKASLRPVFYLSLSRFSQFAFPLSVNLNKKMNCANWWGRRTFKFLAFLGSSSNFMDYRNDLAPGALIYFWYLKGWRLFETGRLFGTGLNV